MRQEIIDLYDFSRMAVVCSAFYTDNIKIEVHNHLGQQDDDMSNWISEKLHSKVPVNFCIAVCQKKIAEILLKDNPLNKNEIEYFNVSIFMIECSTGAFLTKDGTPVYYPDSIEYNLDLFPGIAEALINVFPIMLKTMFTSPSHWELTVMFAEIMDVLNDCQSQLILAYCLKKCISNNAFSDIQERQTALNLLNKIISLNMLMIKRFKVQVIPSFEGTYYNLLGEEESLEYRNFVNAVIRKIELILEELDCDNTSKDFENTMQNYAEKIPFNVKELISKYNNKGEI